VTSDPRFVLIDFRQPSTLRELEKYIGVHPGILEAKLNSETSSFFYRHIIPKRKPKPENPYRVVWQAKPSLEDAYKSFARRFDLFAQFIESRFPHHSAYGYVRGRGILDNAICHAGAPKILHADIQNFFPSISDTRLKNLFLMFGIQEIIADALSKFVTIDGFLPLGVHSSPLLANLVCLDLDEKLVELAKNYDCVYTRYADDISISGKEKIPEKEEIKSFLSEEGFILSEHKCRITKRGQAHYVTGLSVSDSNPHVPRRMKKELRKELYYCKKFGIADHLRHVYGPGARISSGINRIDGTIRYLSHIEREIIPGIRKEWSSLLKRDGLSVSYEPVYKYGDAFFKFYVDECEIQHRGKTYLALSFVKTRDQDYQKIEITTLRTLRDYLVDPFSGGDKESALKKGIHYSDANEDLRKSYTDQVSIFPFNSYVVYGELSSYDNYLELYISLIKKILPHRLMGCDGAKVEIIFEENSRIGKQSIRRCVFDIFDSLEQKNDRRPARLDAKVGTKSEHVCFSLPDFLLGVFSRYAKFNDGNKTERSINFFEKLRDKYRVILDADSGIVFSRKRPFVPWN
jgi:RNA-directed DNA polymerase